MQLLLLIRLHKLGLQDFKYFKTKKKPGKTKAFFICLLIASFLWLVHALNTVYSYTLKVPVTFVNLPQNKQTIIEIPKFLFVQLKASGLKLSLILLNKPFEPVIVDFNNMKSVNRNQSYILSSADINFKSTFKFETQVKHISPDTLYFAEKTGYQKMITVKIPLFIKCKPGFGIKTPVLDPSVITIWGDTALIKRTDTIYTQPVNLTNVDHDIDEYLALIKPNPGIYTSINETKLNIEVLRLIEQAIVLPVNAISAKDHEQINIFPSKVKVKFTYLQNNFELKDTSLFRVVVNSDKLSPITKKSAVYISALPPNITVMTIEPKDVEILIIKK